MFSDQQYNAAHNSAALIERSSRGTVALTGADRASFLHALLTNDIAASRKVEACMRHTSLHRAG